MLYVCWLTAFLAYESVYLIEMAIIHKANLLDLSAAFLTVYGPLGAVMTFVSKLYWDSRDKETNE